MANYLLKQDTGLLLKQDNDNLIWYYGTAVTVTDVGTTEILYTGQTGVVITGTTFLSPQGTGTVTLNSALDGTGTSVAQTVTAWNTTSITITVAQGTLSSGPVYLFVTNSNKASNTGFVVNVGSRPTVTDVEDNVVYDGETGVIIRGNYYGATQGSGLVNLSSAADGSGTNVAQTVTSWSTTAITITASQGALTSGTVYVRITNNIGLVIATGFGISIYPLPVITDAGTELFYHTQTGVVITGTGFETAQGTGTVKLHSLPDGLGSSQTQTVTAWTTGTSITVTINQGSLTSGTLYLIITTDKGMVSASYPVTVGPRPTITDLADESFIDGETGVVVTGTGFNSTQDLGYVELNTASNRTGYGRVQPVSSWATTSITISIDLGDLTSGTLYAFVTNAQGLTNATGYSVTVAEAPIPGVGQDFYIDYVPNSPLTISHNDGALDYDTGSGTIPTADSYIRGGTSGAVAKILSITGTAASGSMNLTNTTTRFQNNEALTWLNQVNFDGVVNGGVTVGDVVTGASSGRTGTIRAIEYLGTSGTLYSEGFTGGSWTNNENIQVGGQTRALADGTGTINSTQWTSALANGVLTPATAAGILNYEGGSVSVPPDASVSGSVSLATGMVHLIYGSTSTGSLFLNDVTGTWQDGETLVVQQVVNYDNQVVNQQFRVGDVVTGSVSGTTARVLKVIDDGDSTGRLFLADRSGTFDHLSPDDLEVNNVKIAEVENNTFTSSVANVNGTLYTTQTPSQGGLYASSLNPVRSVNSLYTYLMDTFGQIDQLDDLIPMTAQVKNQQYTLVNSWTIPDLSLRFLDQGSLQDENQDNIWTNVATIGDVQGISDERFAAVAPQPQLYLSQNSQVLSPFWLEGHLNVLIKVKTNSLAAVNDSEGQLLDNGTLTVYARHYTHLYSHEKTSSVGGVATVPLSTISDVNNPTATYTLNYDNESAGPFLVGEPLTLSDYSKTGRIVSLTDNGTTGVITYVLTSTSNFADNENVYGQSSGADALVNGSPTSVVAGYTDVTAVFGASSNDLSNGNGARPYDCVIDCNSRPLSEVYEYLKYLTAKESTATVNGLAGNLYQAVGDIRLPFDTQTGNFTQGLTLTGALSGATGVIVSNHDAGATGALIVRNVSGNFLNNETITDTSTGSAAVNGSTETIGRTEAAPFGTLAGGKFFGARGIWLENVDATDATNFELIDSEGIRQVPPNNVPLEITGVVQNTQCYIIDAIPTEYLNTPATTLVAGDTYKASTTLTYSTDIDVTVRAREMGYLPFETTGTITGSGLSVTAVWQVDPNWKLVVSGINISFTNPDTITRASGNFTTDGWLSVMGQVTIEGSATNDGTYTLTTVGTTTVTVSSGISTAGAAAGITLTFTRRSLA